eukprot:TRINITY_DN303_c0_g1_i1.p1 TRINITY_DN303_c0_g1~~TRINITY_DN303_c0_g1_i1.p1  ORF type:complete len:184 (-),score=9.83 TRINITY_DN303_c0_g1_i1:1187-1738(-)
MPDIDELSLGARLSKLTALFAAASPVELAEAISRQCREAQGMNSTSLAYGELCMTDTTALVERIATKHMGFRDGGTLVDIGSGAGLALLAASLPHQFDRAYGIEILSGLHRKAEENLAQWRSQSAHGGSTSNISFVEGDITEIGRLRVRFECSIVEHASRASVLMFAHCFTTYCMLCSAAVSS